MARSSPERRDDRRHDSRIMILLTALGTVIAAIGLANATGLVIGNSTVSVPRGFYYAVEPARAGYVSFCLARRHDHEDFYRHFCSPDHPNGIRILKRIAAHTNDGHLIVEGDTPRALDSRFVGPVHRNQVRGWWQPVIQIGAY